MLKLIAAIDENKTLEVNRANVEAKEQNDTKELKELIEKIRVSNSYLQTRRRTNEVHESKRESI